MLTSPTITIHRWPPGIVGRRVVADDGSGSAALTDQGARPRHEFTARLLQETPAARTIRCDQVIDATPRPLSAVGGAVGGPAA